MKAKIVEKLLICMYALFSIFSEYVHCSMVATSGRLCFVSTSWSHSYSRSVESFHGRGSSCSFRRARNPPSILAAESNGWMFPSAKDYHSDDKSLFEIPVLALPFGDVIVVGEEREIALSRPGDMLLAQQAFNRTDVAHTVGSASAVGSSANHQGFLAGSVATRLRLTSVTGSVAGADMVCRVRAVGRVRLDSLRRTRPYCAALAAPLRDAPPTDAAQRRETAAALDAAAQLHAACRQLHAALLAQEVAARLARLARPDPTLLIPEAQHLELARAAAAASLPRRRDSAAASRSGAHAGRGVRGPAAAGPPVRGAARGWGRRGQL